MEVIQRTTPLDPTVTNFPIQVCLAFGRDLKKAAKDVLARIPDNLPLRAWNDDYHGKPIDNLRYNVSIFGALRQKAHFNNDLVVGQMPEFKKLEKLEERIDQKIRELDERVTSLQQHPGVPYFPGQGGWAYTTQSVTNAAENIFSEYAGKSPSSAQKEPNTFIYNSLEFLHKHRALTFAAGAIFTYYAIQPDSGLQEWLTAYATPQTIRTGKKAAETASQVLASYGAQILKTAQNISFMPSEAKALIGGSAIPAAVWVAKRSLDCLPAFHEIKNKVKEHKVKVSIAAVTLGTAAFALKLL